MARGRLISKSLGSSRKFHAVLQVGGKLGEFCQVLFPLIVANTDDFGRMPGDAFTVKNVVLPSSHRPEPDFDKALTVLHTVGLIVRYEANDGIFLQVNNFDDHQVNLHKRSASRFPEIPESPGNSGKVRSNLTESNLTESNLTQPRTALTRSASDGFEQFWAAYPKKKAKDAALRAWQKRRPDGELLLTILAALSAQRHSADWLKESGRFIPFPATWLNRGQWTDSPDPITPALSERSVKSLVATREFLES